MNYNFFAHPILTNSPRIHPWVNCLKRGQETIPIVSQVTNTPATPGDTLWYDENGKLKDQFVVYKILFHLGKLNLVQHHLTYRYIDSEPL